MVFNDSVWYKNSFCQECWSHRQDSSLLRKLREQPRFCVPYVEACRISRVPASIKQRASCDGYMEPLSYGNLTHRKRYRNPACLLCDNDHVDWMLADCFVPDVESHLLGPRKRVKSGHPHFPLRPPMDYDPDSRTMADSIMANTFNYGLPESISVMINFGVEDKHIMYSAENWAHGCTQDELWDPFSQVCREVYCASDFDLVNFECVGDSIGGNGSSSSVEPPITLPSTDVIINLTILAVGVNVSDPDVYLTPLISAEFASSFASMFMISEERISNLLVTYNRTRVLSTSEDIINELVNSTFDLLEQLEEEEDEPNFEQTPSWMEILVSF